MKKTFLGVVLTLLGTGISYGTPSMPFVLDYTEQSDFEESGTMQIGDNVVESITAAHTTKDPLIIVYDFYRFVATASGKLTVSDQGEGNTYGAIFVDADLSDAKKIVAYSKDIDNGNFRCECSVEEGKTYWIGIRSNSGTPITSAHTITLSLAQASEEQLLTPVTAQNYAELGLDESFVGYYAISTAAQLESFTDDIWFFQHDAFKAGRYVLTNDIVVNEHVLDADGNLNEEGAASFRQWTPINLDFDIDTYPRLMNPHDIPTEVVFDANGHTISGLYQTTGDDLGFASTTSYAVSIRNLGITDSYFEANEESSIGSLVAQNKGDIEDCWSDATIVANHYKEIVGGLVGEMRSGTINSSYYKGHIVLNEGSGAGGIVALINLRESWKDGANIRDCHFSGTITDDSNSMYAAGIACEIEIEDNTSLLIERCYADGKAIGLEYLLGLFGEADVEKDGSMYVVNNYNAMTVEDVAYYFGLFGELDAYNTYRVRIACNVNLSDDADNVWVECDQQFLLFNLTLGDSDDNEESLLFASREELATGMYAYLLNEMYTSMFLKYSPMSVLKEPMARKAINDTWNEKNGHSQIWYQEIGIDPFPVLQGDEYSIVYFNGASTIDEAEFFNTPRPVDEYALADGETYAGRLNIVADFTYTRTVTSDEAGKWQALYVPFAAPISAWNKAGFDVAAINNFHEYYDENGQIEKRELEVRLIKGENSETSANYPYLIRANEAGNKTIKMENVILNLAKGNSISCSSTDTQYTFTGTYQTVSGLADEGMSIMKDGDLCQATDDEETLCPQRWFVIAEKYDLQWMQQERVVLTEPIHICVVGEDDSTGIEDIAVKTSKATAREMLDQGIYDLYGRRLKNSSTEGVSVKNHAKMMVK